MAQKEIKRRKTKLKPPTAKQKAFVKEYLRSKNITKSARKVYNVKNDKNASALGRNTLSSPNVQFYLQTVLEDAGLTDKDLSVFLREIIEASRAKEALEKATPSDGLRGIEMAFKLLDRFPAERKQIEKKEFRLKLEAKSPEELGEMLDSLLSEGRKYKELITKEVGT